MIAEKLKKYEDGIKVLDSGFVRLIDVMGDDSSIVQAARVSYGDGTKSVSDDRSLARYLMRHQHLTPYEMCEIKLHVKAPIFVVRQWLRHRTFSVNEVSRRYSVVPEDYYIPELERIGEQSADNKQGTGDILEEKHAHACKQIINDSCKNSIDIYNKLITENDEFPGIARELARTVTPVGSYTELYLKVDLRNLFNFLRLRMDGHAQYEIRVYADAIAKITKDWVPVAYEAFEDYMVYSKSISRQEFEIVSSLIERAKSSFNSKDEYDEFLKSLFKNSNLGLREKKEFLQKFSGV